MAKHAEFDVILRWAGNGRFDLTILFNAPRDIEDYQYFSAAPIQVDVDRLDELSDDARAYGVALGQLLFPQGASSYLDRALRLAQEMPVYMRLVVGDDAPLRYQTIRWETLRHPISGLRITTSENIRFCRYLSNPDGTPPSSLAPSEPALRSGCRGEPRGHRRSRRRPQPAEPGRCGQGSRPG